ncbi:DUF6680 family protein [Pectobacterium versatile]|uniref:DUF6680 family protein n=1 Tax=Pectobacterium versatile TaxID=2488639 RepID=UPI001F464D13|nr:DUF6680 family protein [Pectobacterium versatile]
MALGMELKDWIMTGAVIAGPILAVQAQKIIESIRSKKQRRLNLFHVLMSTRAIRLSPEHVSALNMIDIEFYGRKILGVRIQTKSEKQVTNAWKVYNNQLNASYTPETLNIWNDRVVELFTSMLYAISQALGYDFDEVQLKRDFYKPKGHGDIEEQQSLVRTGIVDILTGNKSLSVHLTNIDIPQSGMLKDNSQ